MPAPAVIAAGIGAAGNVVGSGLNAFSTANMNRKSRKFSREMYELQKQDNIDFWTRQNTYNSPAQQMERYREAGLNPALMYGSSSSAGQASSIQTPDVQTPQFRTPEYGGMLSFMDKLYDLEIKQAQVDNLKTDNTVKQNTADLIEMQTGSGQFDWDYKSDLREINADFRKEEYRKLKTDTQFQLDENERRTISTRQNIAESMERVLYMQAQKAKTAAEKDKILETIKNLKTEGSLKNLHLAMRRKGIEPHDPFSHRILGRTLDVLKKTGAPGLASIMNDILEKTVKAFDQHINPKR